MALPPLSPGHCIPVLLLDTDLDEHQQQWRNHHDLYGSNGAPYRLKQELVAKSEGHGVSQRFGFKDHAIYHLNEGHAALLTAYLLRQFEAKCSMFLRRFSFMITQ